MKKVTWFFPLAAFCFLVNSTFASEPVARYTFDEGPEDVTGNGYDGTFVGDAYIEEGGYLALDGDNDAVEIPMIGTFNQLTYALWIYPTVDPLPLEFCGGMNTNGWDAGAVHFKLNYGKLNVGINGLGSDVVGTTVVAPEEWSHIALTVSDTVIALYLNGALEASRTFTGPPNLIVGNALIGGWNNPWSGQLEREMTGMMDEVLIYDQALSEEEIDCLYYNMSAYIWWYLRQPDCNLINTGGSLKKKGYIMAHFSKFIRPGYHRIDATYRPQASVYLVTVKGEETVIVVVNLNSTSKDQIFKFNNDSIAHVKRYTTSETKNLSYDGIIDLTDNSFTATLEGKSITTFVSTKTSTGVKPIDSPILPSYGLEQNYPNPFNSSTKISWQSPVSSWQTLKVYDVLGNEVATLVDEYKPGGRYEFEFDASQLSSGVYFYRLQSGSFVETKKLVLLR